jgi:hypothetical protein
MRNLEGVQPSIPIFVQGPKDPANVRTGSFPATWFWILSLAKQRSDTERAHREKNDGFHGGLAGRRSPCFLNAADDRVCANAMEPVTAEAKAQPHPSLVRTRTGEHHW